MCYEHGIEKGKDKQEQDEIYELHKSIASLKYKLFRSWKHFNGSVVYPVGGEDEFAAIENVAENPLRVDLAEHLLKGFKDYIRENSV